MAEKKKKTIIDAGTGKETTAGAKSKRTVKEAAPVGNSAGYRVGAVVLWLAAIALEVLALFIYLGKFNLKIMPTTVQIVLALVLDLVCVIVGSQLWKKANHIKPASEKNPFLFWLWNNMGVIVCAFAFIPFVILALKDKNADKKTKAIATVAAIIALMIGGLASYDWDPISDEEKQAQMEAVNTDVFWSPFGKVYHTSEDCHSLNKSDTLTKGSVEEAIADGRTRLCLNCEKRDAKALEEGTDTTEETTEEVTDTTAEE